VTEKKEANGRDLTFLGRMRGLSIPFLEGEEDFHGGVTLERLHRCSF
jgi:hypothetical protein